MGNYAASVSDLGVMLTIRDPIEGRCKMNDEIKVHVVKYPDRNNLVMRYFDPSSGKQVQRSTGTTKQRDAERKAAKWEAELRENHYQKPCKMSWEDFRTYYSDNALPGLAVTSMSCYETTLNVFERVANPQRLADVTTERVTGFATELRRRGRREATVGHHLRHLKATMRWANRQGLLTVLPQFDMPKRVKGAKIMRGRAVTAEEFERMLQVVPKIVENTAAESWAFYLRSLWESGLRLSESLMLRWDNAPDSIVVDLTGRRPMLRIAAEAEKGNQDRLLPITPEFAKLLTGVPESERGGRVFKLLDIDGTLLLASRTNVGKMVSAIGKAAGVVVDERRKGGNTVRKFASAHDLRRAFGQRWAGRVMPTVLRELMRHASIATTMAYYVGDNAEATADVLWNAVGTSSGTTHHQ
jgi:integrase